MALRILKSFSCENTLIKSVAIPCFIRHGHRMRGKPPGVAKTLEQKMKEKNAVDPEVVWKIDIGFPYLKQSRSAQLKVRLNHLKALRKNGQIEKLSRDLKLEADLDEVKSEWLKMNGPFHVRKYAEHYGVFEHLFGAAFFIPRVFLDIKYGDNPVFYGNLLKATDTKAAPEVTFDANFNYKGEPAKTDSLWTLLMTNPDGHLTENDSENIHWFIANIPNGDVSKGEVIVPHMQAIPYKGTGFHRHVFILYKHDKKMDFGEYKLKNSQDLSSRTFKTYDFYKKFQDDITPAGLAFFQADWDDSVTDFHHKVLDCKEPRFEYDFPAPYIRDQEWFPRKRAFNLYMDKYRDPKQINKEYLKLKLAKTHPFDGPEPPLRFPNAHSLKDMPSWLITEKKKNRLGWGRINDYKN